MSDAKPREFWLVCDTDKDMSASGFIYVRESGHLNEIHVIEYSAYEALLKERDELKAEVERLNNMTQKQYQMEWAIAVKERDELKERVARLKDALEMAQGKLQESINGQFRKFYDEADKDMRLAKSFIDAALRVDEELNEPPK